MLLARLMPEPRMDASPPGLPATAGPRPAQARRPAEAPPAGDLTTADALLPRPGRGFLLAFLLAALRPGARRWLGPERLARMAARLGRKEPAVVQMLDAPPSVPEALREGGGWTGRRVPLLRAEAGIDWIDLHWRADAQAVGAGLRPPGPEDGAFAVRLALPGLGAVELRGRLEGGRLDAVAEIEATVQKSVMADMVDGLELALSRLGLQGRLAVRCGRRQFRT